jgi:DHA2 family multidrug resistance protein
MPTALPRSAAGKRNPWLIALMVSIATFMEVLDATIVNVALPHIAGSLAASLDEATWILTSYLVANAIVLPISGWLANVLGRNRFYMICVALFTGSSVLCAMSTSLMTMLLARALQGAAAAGWRRPSSRFSLTHSRRKSGHWHLRCMASRSSLHQQPGPSWGLAD